MEYTNNPNRVDPKVKEIQSMLNRALDNAVLLLKADSSLPSLLGDPHYFQTLHHRNYLPNGWEKISEDGRFGNETEKAVKKFQEFLYITVNGIVGNTTYTYLVQLSSINSCSIKILGIPITSKNNNVTNADSYEYIKELQNAVIIAVKGFPSLACEWLVEEDSKLQKTNKKAIYDISHWINKLTRDFYCRLIQFMRTKNSDLEEAAEKISKYTKKLYKTSKKKKKEFVKKIEEVLKKAFKGYEKTKLNPKSILQQFQIGDALKQVGKWTGRIANWFDVAQALVPLIGDLNAETETEGWTVKWNKHVGDLIEVLLGAVVAAITGIIVVKAGIVTLIAIVLCAVVSAIFHFIFSLLRKTTWGAELEKKTGSLAYNAIKTFQEWSQVEYERGSPIFTPGFSGPFR